VYLAARDPAALDSVIRVYWKPLYFFVRQKGYDHAAAEDAVQSFLVMLLERKVVAQANPGRGRFRSLLLAALDNYLRDCTKHRSRQKRGKGRKILSLDFAEGEKEYALQVAGRDRPDLLVDRAWARALFAECLSQLKGNPAHLEALKLHLAGTDYRTIAERTGLTETAARLAVHRLHMDFRELLTRHILQTAVDKDELESEIRHFITLLR
jgi:RNA polymerase sigma-70 factor (ECF subfamily)